MDVPKCVECGKPVVITALPYFCRQLEIEFTWECPFCGCYGRDEYTIAARTYEDKEHGETVLAYDGRYGDV